jgi:hypothetical protein
MHLHSGGIEPRAWLAVLATTPVARLLIVIENADAQLKLLLQYYSFE